ncbi:uncharacterized protein [Nicotiana sylvestris]|uniref:uncharacterized protein n=1 Tax=Nicotiana sylvestris TaxID=4096 RepID=UPI00388C686C
MGDSAALSANVAQTLQDEEEDGENAGSILHREAITKSQAELNQCEADLKRLIEERDTLKRLYVQKEEEIRDLRDELSQTRKEEAELDHQRKIDSERREPKKEKNLVLKAESNDSSEENSDIAYLTKRFHKMVRRNGGILKRGNSSKPKNYDLYHKCGKPGHFIQDCPLLKQKHSKYNPEKAIKRNPVPDKYFKRKRSADNVVKQDLAAWGDSSCESEDKTDTGDNSMMAV